MLLFILRVRAKLSTSSPLRDESVLTGDQPISSPVYALHHDIADWIMTISATALRRLSSSCHPTHEKRRSQMVGNKKEGESIFSCLVPVSILFIPLRLFCRAFHYIFSLSRVSFGVRFHLVDLGFVNPVTAAGS